jgi:F420-dependent oxidoreductase-like protein
MNDVAMQLQVLCSTEDSVRGVIVKGLRIGVQVAASDATGLIAQIVEAERAGVDVAWMTTGGLAADPLPVFAAAARETQRISFGTSIMPTFPRHPLALAQAAQVVAQLAPNRLLIGVGTSTKRVIEGTFGIPFQRSQRELREYVTVLKAILQHGAVSFSGEVYQAKGALAEPVQVPVMAAALHTSAYRLCGEVADGAISWVSPLSYLRDAAVPALLAGARRAGRAKPAMVAHVAIAVSDDPVAVRDAFRRQLGIYPRFPVYADMFREAGFPEALEGKFSDAMVDAVAISGSTDIVIDRMRGLSEYGIDEVIVSLLRIGDGSESTNRTLAALGEAARGN